MEKFPTPQPEKPELPEITIPTQDTYLRTTADRTLRSIPDSKVGRPEELTPRERVSYFEAAYNAIVGNKKLERLVVKALKRTDIKDMTAFAQVMNTFTEYCVSLTDKEIDDLLRNFKMKLMQNVHSYAAEFALTENDERSIRMGRLGAETFDESLNTKGVKSVVRFVRARKKIHELSPVTIPAFYFNDFLDAQHKIDLIEIIQDVDSFIMNLIQVKSKEYKDDEIKNITQAHKRWVYENAVDLESYERTHENHSGDSAEYRKFSQTVSNLEDVFLEVLLDSNAIKDIDVLAERFQLSGVTQSQRIWIMSHYIKISLNLLEKMEKDNMLTKPQVDVIESFFKKIKSQLDVLTQPKDRFNGISEIHSICTNEDKVVSDEIIFKAEGGQRKVLVTK